MANHKPTHHIPLKTTRHFPNLWKTCVKLRVYPRVNQKQNFVQILPIHNSHVQNSTFPQTLPTISRRLSHNSLFPVRNQTFPLFHRPYYYNY